jgi:hypothetical protein
VSEHAQTPRAGQTSKTIYIGYVVVIVERRCLSRICEQRSVMAMSRLCHCFVTKLHAGVPIQNSRRRRPRFGLISVDLDTMINTTPIVSSVWPNGKIRNEMVVVASRS